MSFSIFIFRLFLDGHGILTRLLAHGSKETIYIEKDKIVLHKTNIPIISPHSQSVALFNALLISHGISTLHIFRGAISLRKKRPSGLKS